MTRLLTISSGYLIRQRLGLEKLENGLYYGH